MSSQVETLENKQVVTKTNIIEKIKTNGELIAAAGSGVLILLGWLADKGGFITASIILYVVSFFIGGYAKAKEGIEDTVQNKKLNVEMLMILAAIGSVIIGYWIEGAILIFIFAMSGALETYTMNKSHKELSALMEMQPDEALKITDHGEYYVPVSELIVGDYILIKPGERVPSDGEITNGMTNIDEAAITGEATPVFKGIGEEVFAGTMNMNGSITVRITKPSNETLFQKIIELVQSAQSEKSPSQLFIERFEGKYVNIVLAVVTIMIFLPHFLLGWSWNESFYRAMILLVVASPCALVASITPATLAAISNGAKRGILFKSGIHLEQLGHLQAIAFDKTGTLTKGKPEVTDVIVREQMDADEVLQAIASIERHSNHPLANAIVKYARTNMERPFIEPDQIKDVPGWGMEAVIDHVQWRIGKKGYFDQAAVKQFVDSPESKLASEGKTVVFAEKAGELVGLIALKDMVRAETKEAIDQVKRQGIYTIMLTGDSVTTAEAVAADTHVHERMAECLPENKVEHLRALKQKYGNVAMVGDGINDAPALATANVGISMGEGTDVALETADIVLMKNDLSRIPEAIQLSKRMNRIIKQNIIFSIGIILLLIASNFLQMLDLPFGVIGHEGSTILVILNSLRLLK
ncbi:heavy metal translocating P-type ATPase [Bacillus sp. FJAT-50079]|uniref:heavy metal translocating P-type ATPase n=1 Tax=Bacillus sp. FJAT-50079 TaxID=2833577 RepID=UPI001BC8DFC6|nr:heavy metal translocating P-type ATPase [Bacillus sp. FJAT-50079]MBS4210125.1 cadmium-translocating P-type ATPase [Bacillus sp. FJAT-50079]